MSLHVYLVRRLLLMIPLILGISLVAFFISNLVPGDPVAAALGQSAMSEPEIVETFKKEWGLDKSPVEQYFVYLNNLLHGNLGRSIKSRRPVSEDLQAYFPATIELATAGILVSLIAGIIFGVVSAVWRNHWVDFVARALSLVGVSAPVFWLALVLMYILYARLRILPGPGRLDVLTTPPPHVTGFFTIDSLLAGQWDVFIDALRHLILPAMVLGAYSAGLITRITRSSMLEALAEDYMKTARAKGLRERTVIIRHALRNALMPVVTIIGLSYANLLSGAVLTETIFAWPGIGRYAYRAAISLDFPAIMGVSMLIALIFISINLVVDVLYYFLDPRLKAS